MTKLANLIKNRSLLLGLSVIMNFAGTVATLYGVSAAAHAQPQTVAGLAASPVHTQTVHTQNVHIGPAFLGRIEAVRYTETLARGGYHVQR